MIQSDRDGTHWEINDDNSGQTNIEVARDTSALVDAFTRTSSKIKRQITNNEMKELVEDFKNDDECAIPDLDDLAMQSGIMSINAVPRVSRKLPTLKELVSFRRIEMNLTQNVWNIMQLPHSIMYAYYQTRIFIVGLKAWIYHGREVRNVEQVLSPPGKC